MQVTGLRRRFLTALITFFVLSLGIHPSAAADSDAPSPNDIVDKYLQAKEHGSELRGMSMEVEINAQVPKRKESGTLRALRKISKVGQITYRQIAFQGTNFVRTEIIARYLAADQQEQDDHDISITPANYKFKYKGVVSSQANDPAFIFQLTPRKKKVGLFKGEMWIDGKTYLPVFEKGRLVKNPSIFFRQVDFRRGFAVQNGLAVPSYIASTIDTRLVGKIEISISFSKFTQNNGAEGEDDVSHSAKTQHSMLRRPRLPLNVARNRMSFGKL